MLGIIIMAVFGVAIILLLLAAVLQQFDCYFDLGSILFSLAILLIILCVGATVIADIINVLSVKNY